MIVWPDESKLHPEGRDGLHRFRRTGAFAELESSPEQWHVVSWPWNRESPVRVQLENDRHQALDFTLDEEGVWRIERDPRATRLRTWEEKRMEAEGIVLGIDDPNELA